MTRIPDIVPVSEFRQGAAELLKRLRKTRGPVVVTQRGRAAAVLLSVDEYERRERETEILKLLAQGEKEIAAGVGHSLDDVLAEADELLGQDNP